MKKIDKLVLNSFIGPFILTFLVVVFILLMQHMLKYFDDLVGKDLGWDVLGQLLFYFAVFMTPVAMPLAVLLSSLITFGNLGEHFELTAIKSAGISLLRALQPIFIFVVFLTALAFYINNNLVPKAALEAYSLLYDIKQKKPALDLREGSFYMGIPDISIKINKKFHKDAAALKGVIIYDHRKNEGNKEVTVADSGRMYTILNERYLKLELYNGYNYNEGSSGQEEMTGQKSRTSNSESLSRSQFAKSQVLFDLSSFQMARTDKKWFQGNRIMRNLSELDVDIDSINREVLSQRLDYFLNRGNYFTYFRRNDKLELPEDVARYKKRKDSLASAPYLHPPVATQSEIKPVEKKTVTTVVAENVKPSKAPAVVAKKKITGKTTNAARRNKQNAFQKQKSLAQQKLKETKVKAAQKATIVKPPVKKINNDSLITHRIDSLSVMPSSKDNYQAAANAARQVKSQLQNTNTNVANYVKEKHVFEIQWHKIIANSMACIAMFLIGAPLGAIIKKGGLGVPFLISILFFIVYYVMNMMGEKWAKQGAVAVFSGVWGADLILFVVGALFLRQARADTRLFDSDFYMVIVDKIKRWFKQRNAISKARKVA